MDRYHERWELELGYDGVKTRLLPREEAIRSQTPEGVRRGTLGILLAYNMVRLEMARVAAEAKVAPTRISFVSIHAKDPIRVGVAGDHERAGNDPEEAARAPRRPDEIRSAAPAERRKTSAHRQDQDEPLPAKASRG